MVAPRGMVPWDLQLEHPQHPPGTLRLRVFSLVGILVCSHLSESGTGESVLSQSPHPLCLPCGDGFAQSHLFLLHTFKQNYSGKWLWWVLGAEEPEDT